jgi:hypothetical protein
MTSGLYIRPEVIHPAELPSLLSFKPGSEPA